MPLNLRVLIGLGLVVIGLGWCAWVGTMAFGGDYLRPTVACSVPTYDPPGTTNVECIALAGAVNSATHDCCTLTYTQFSNEWWDCITASNGVMFMREQICCLSCNDCPQEETPCDESLFQDCTTPEFTPSAYLTEEACRQAATQIKDIERACCGEVWGDYVEAREVCRSSASAIKQARFDACALVFNP